MTTRNEYQKKDQKDVEILQSSTEHVCACLCTCTWAKLTSGEGGQGTVSHYDGSDSHQRPDYTGRLEIERQTNSGNKGFPANHRTTKEQGTALGTARRHNDVNGNENRGNVKDEGARGLRCTRGCCGVAVYDAPLSAGDKWGKKKNVGRNAFRSWNEMREGGREAGGSVKS